MPVIDKHFFRNKLTLRQIHKKFRYVVKLSGCLLFDLVMYLYPTTVKNVYLYKFGSISLQLINYLGEKIFLLKEPESKEKYKCS